MPCFRTSSGISNIFGSIRKLLSRGSSCSSTAQLPAFASVSVAPVSSWLMLCVCISPSHMQVLESYLHYAAGQGCELVVVQQQPATAAQNLTGSLTGSQGQRSNSGRVSSGERQGGREAHVFRLTLLPIESGSEVNLLYLQQIYLSYACTS